jgi:NAD(P)-dependent dehydrogenase (short-subunit alcohol dehydrogenase family)
MSSFKGKLIAITGSASGIGLALAKLLASRGASLSLADIQADALNQVAKDLSDSNTQVLSTIVDVTDPTAVEKWLTKTAEHFKCPLDGAANVAGDVGKSTATDAGSIRNVSNEEFDFVYNVNVKGTWNCLRSELNHMKKGKDGHGGGSIVNVSSIAGLIGIPFSSPYVAAKHAVIGITKTAAKEEGAHAIRVNAVAP